jgi:hypothetical protein
LCGNMSLAHNLIHRFTISDPNLASRPQLVQPGMTGEALMTSPASPAKKQVMMEKETLRSARLSCSSVEQTINYGNATPTHVRKTMKESGTLLNL